MRIRLFAHRLFSLLISLSLLLTPAASQAVSLRTNRSLALQAGGGWNNWAWWC